MKTFACFAALLSAVLLAPAASADDPSLRHDRSITIGFSHIDVIGNDPQLIKSGNLHINITEDLIAGTRTVTVGGNLETYDYVNSFFESDWISSGTVTVTDDPIGNTIHVQGLLNGYFDPHYVDFTADRPGRLGANVYPAGVSPWLDTDDGAAGADVRVDQNFGRQEYTLKGVIDATVIDTTATGCGQYCDHANVYYNGFVRAFADAATG